MRKFTIGGMSCAACSTRIEKTVGALNGVNSCSVSLLTNSMLVNGALSDAEIISAVESIGYSATSYTDKSIKTDANEFLQDKETPKLKKRLFSSLFFLIILMYISMGHMMWNFPLPDVLVDNHIAIGILQLILTGIVMVINQKFFVSGFKGLIKRAPNMDTLVALGSSAAFIYSVYELLAITYTNGGGHEFYFESAAMILTLITVGKLLEARSKGKTTDALKGLMTLAPKTATVVRDGKEAVIPVENMRLNDIFLIRPGENIPTDGVVIDGESSVDESALTGESIPTDKLIDSYVSAGTHNVSGFLKCRATKVGEDTTLAGIIRTVSDAAATKAPIAKAADKVSGVFVPVVIGIAILTVIGWLIADYSFGYSLARGISVLVISCPCALGLATPVAVTVGSGIGAKNGILYKTAASLEEAGRVNIVALDKTGTITNGSPQVTDILPLGCTENELLSLAYSIEINSEHPLSKAIVSKAEEMKIAAKEITEFRSVTGNGLSGKIDGVTVTAGNKGFASQFAMLPDEFVKKADELANEGKTPLWFCSENSFVGIIAVADVIKSDSATAANRLKNMGIKVVMLTGDNEKTARAVGAQAGIDDVIAGVLPERKEYIIRTLQRFGKVAMVGDGINDSPALTRADVGIAIGAGTDIAIDSADIVLMNSKLSDVPALINLSRASLRNIYENLFWAFIYNIIGIPVAAGALIPVFGIELNPMLAAAAMSLSSFCVVANALRLNFFNIHKTKNIRKRKTIDINLKEELQMETVLKIEGMMCPHCQARVKSTLEAIDGVSEALVSHESGTATVKHNGVERDVLANAVEAQGYKVIG